MCSFYGKIYGVIYNPKTDKWKWWEGPDADNTALTEEIDIPTLSDWFQIMRGKWLYKSSLGHSYKNTKYDPISLQKYNCPIIVSQPSFIADNLSTLQACSNYAINNVYGKYLSGFYFIVKAIDPTKNVKFKVVQNADSISWFGTGINMKIQDSTDSQNRTTVLNQVSESTIEAATGDTYFAYIYCGWRFNYLDHWNGELENLIHIEPVENCTIE